MSTNLITECNDLRTNKFDFRIKVDSGPNLF